MKANFFFSTLFVVGLLLLSGCASICDNLTPQKGPQNSSNTYSMRMKSCVKDKGLVAGSVQPQIVINGQTYSMKKDPLLANTFVYDYKMPAEQNHVSYYYLVHYKTQLHGSIRDCLHSSDLYRFELINRYAHALEADRGHIGASVTIVGRGFSPSDVVKLGDISAKTTYVSSNTISFTVPLVPGNKAYPVRIQNEQAALHIGSFYVDASDFALSIDCIELVSEDKVEFSIKTNMPALDIDLPLHITTDIPDHIIMDPVVIPAGSTSVTVNLECIGRAKGSLHIQALGFNEKVIPVTIIEKPSHHKEDIVVL